MAYSSYVGSFNIDTAKTAGQTQAITGVGFTPKIVLFWWSGTTASTDGARGEDISAGFGAMSGSSSRFAVATMSDDAAATTVVNRSQTNAACIVSYLNGTGTQDGAADWGSLDADGFTLTIDDQFSTALRVSYLALGGSDLTNVYIGSKQSPSATGNYGTTGVGFQPDALLFATAGRNALAQTGTQGNFSLGMATGASNQGVIYWYSQNGAATSNSTGYGYGGECITANGNNDRESLVSMDSDGFTLNKLENFQAYYYYFVALKGGQYKVCSVNTATDTNTFADTEAGFQPAALLAMSVNRAQSTQDTPTDHASLSIGAATSTSNRAAQAIWDEDNLADSETATANYDTAVYAYVKDDAIVGLMDISSIDATGVTFVMDDADPSASWVTYLAIGAAASTALSVSVTDSATVTDTPTVGSPYPKYVSVSDSATVADAPTVSIQVEISAADSATTTDTPTVDLPVTVSVTDAATVADAPTLLLPELFASAADSSTVAETVTLYLTELFASAADSSAVADAPTVSIAGVEEPALSIVIGRRDLVVEIV